MVMAPFRILVQIPSIAAFEVIAANETEAGALAEEKLSDEDFVFDFNWQPTGDPIKIVSIHLAEPRYPM
jgi:hypothetical protein